MHAICHSSSSHLFTEEIREGRGLCAVVNQPIKSNTTITRNTAFTWHLLYKYWNSRCATCMKLENSSAQLLRCSKCRVSKYCNAKCQKSDFQQHKSVCADLPSIHKKVTVDEIDDVVLLLKTLAVLKKCASECTISGSCVTCGSEHIGKMAIGGGTHDNHMINVISYVSQVSRERMETVAELLVRFKSNNFGIVDELMNCVAVGVYPRAALLNHSCTPNSILRYVMSTNGPILEIVSISQISPGDELTHCYSDCTMPSRERNSHLQKTYGFECDCMACASIYRSESSSSALTEKIESYLGSPLTLRDYINEQLLLYGKSTILKVVDEIKCRLIQERIYVSKRESINQLLTAAETAAIVDNDDKRALELLEEAQSIFLEIAGRGHIDHYKINCRILTSALVLGNNEKAYESCKFIVSYLFLSYLSFNSHPLIGLQLFTLGDIAHSLDLVNESRSYKEAALKHLIVSHGEDSALVHKLQEDLASDTL